MIHFIKKILKGIVGLLNYGGWLFRYIKLNAGMNCLSDIKIITVEFSSVCNLRCKYCFIDKLERPKTLDVEIYEKLIKEIAENPKYHIKHMQWPISGEFFVYPHFREVIEITKKYMDANPNFRPDILLVENLMLFNEERMDLIINSGIVRQLNCSIDGHDAKTFEDMRPPAKFNTVLKNYYRFVEKNKAMGNPIFVVINNGRDERSLGKALSQDMIDVFKRADDVRFWHPENWNESFKRSDTQFSPAKGFCSFVFNNVSLSTSGFISKCCIDLQGLTDYGDFHNQSLEDIWHSQIRRQFLSKMFNNKRSKIKGCENCSIGYSNNDNRYNNVLRSLRRKFAPFFLGKDYILKPYLLVGGTERTKKGIQNQREKVNVHGG